MMKIRYSLSSLAVLLFTVELLAAENICHHGSLVTYFGLRCNCRFGYKGYDCSQEVTPCEGKPCRNNGRCTNLNDGTFECSCQAHYEGVLCEKKVQQPACSSSPCHNAGICSNGKFKCACPSGYTGLVCDKKVTPCEGNPCRNNGRCTNLNDGTFECSCHAHYEGVLCEKKVQHPCSSSPCHNAGICSNEGNGKFKCACPSGYTGLICDKKVTPCEGKPCRNNGRCTNLNDGTFECSCQAHYEGVLCEKKVQQPCSSSPCHNAGICSNEGNGKFKCACPSGYTGLVCDEKDPVSESTVLKGNQTWIEQLKEWLPSDQKGMMKLCYRSTKDGPYASKFHSLCDNKGPTVVLARVGKYVFGGYASESWGGPTRYITANKSFIFSFVNKDGLKPFKSPIYQHFNHALYTDESQLPIFGDGRDLSLGSHGWTSYAYLGNTYKLPDGYDPKSWDTKFLLAGPEEIFFIPDEVEVYYFVTNN